MEPPPLVSVRFAAHFLKRRGSKKNGSNPGQPHVLFEFRVQQDIKSRGIATEGTTIANDRLLSNQLIPTGREWP
jgi:hypothetical protein